MIGLLVIIVLLVFIAVFVVRLFFLSPESNSPVTKENIISNNFFIALLQQSSCQERLIDIAIICNENGQICGEDACFYLENELKTISGAFFDQTQDNAYLQDNMLFTAEIRGNNPFFTFGNCNIGIRDVLPAAPYVTQNQGIFYNFKFYRCM